MVKAVFAFAKRPPVICWAIGLVLFSWLFTACLPFIANKIPRLFTVNHNDDTYLKNYVFPELSAYGEMFCGLGVLFTGIGLIGVALTRDRQRRRTVGH